MEEIKLISEILKMDREDAKLVHEFIFLSDNLDMLAIRSWICNRENILYLYELLVFIKTFLPPREVTEEEVKQGIKKYCKICQEKIFDLKNFKESLRAVANYL